MYQTPSGLSPCMMDPRPSLPTPYGLPEQVLERPEHASYAMLREPADRTPTGPRDWMPTIKAKHALLVTVWEGERSTGMVQYLFASGYGVITNWIRFP